MEFSGGIYREIFEYLATLDNLKLKPSMTLFAHVSPEGSAFERVLDGYFGGRRDGKTLELVRSGG